MTGKLPHRSKLLHLAAGTAALSLVVAPLGEGSWSQTPGTIRIIAPLPPGSALDILSRVLADQISRNGPAVLIENRPGAAGVIGTEAVARAAPDGSVLLVNANPFIVNPLVQRVNYHPLTSFEPICNLVRSPTFIVVKSSAPYRTLADLLEAARAKPGQLAMASIGPGSATQIAFEVLRREAKIDMAFVPFPGIPPALNALLGDHVTSVFALYSG